MPVGLALDQAQIPAWMDYFDNRHLGVVRRGLSQLTSSPLLIWGEQDDVFPLSHSRTIQHELPTSRLVIMGNWSPLDAPKEVGDHIREFCGSSKEMR